MPATIDFGIDLGTTNSCIARWQEGAVRVFQNNDQMNVTPSAVHVLKTGRVIVGRRAYSALLTDPNNVAIEFKRWMGQKDRKQFPAAQREFSAEQLSAEILKSLREDVRRQTGADATSAVITVPAAFGALQCEATARAAELAGLEEAPLLQEPIAAAIGYGARPGSANQRWLVFDLGGGTLDIAVVSTREGRLSVLEHRGNNLLGGKDIDRLIVERILLPALNQTFDLRSAGQAGSASTLLTRLRVKAEEAKIDLSTENQVLVSLLDLGDDDSGVAIELELPIKRTQLEALMGPILDESLKLARDALAGARMVGTDLDRILLVGGPTQSPILREALSKQIGAPVDFSTDPMTVVGRGAAVYASTLNRTKVLTARPVSGQLQLKLAYDPVSSDLQCPVAGRVLGDSAAIEIKFDAEGGLWTSGWIEPKNGLFETLVSLKEGDIATFWVYARDGQGHLVEVDTPEFRIRHGLVPSSPPLPHVLSVEILTADGKAILDPVFQKGTPLPAAKTVKYRATHALVPNDLRSDLAIKLWEGEFLQDPDANEWVGNVLLQHDGVRRPVPEGSEIEVTIQIDASRLISVEAFVPHLNQHFSGRLYVPQREEQDFSDLARAAASETAKYRERLEEIERTGGAADGSTRADLEELQRDLDALDSRANSRGGQAGVFDPDEARRVVEQSKTIRGRLGDLERRTTAHRTASDSPRILELTEVATNVVEQFGGQLEKQQLAALRREMERASSKGDDRTIQKICAELDGLRWRVLFKHDWFWREIFASLRDPNAPFVNPAEARRLITEGQTAVTAGDGEGIRRVVQALWELQPKGSAELTRERAARTGLRKF